MRLAIRGQYPPDWKAIATAVKLAAHWTCVRCQHPHHVASGHVLTVHHLDGDKGNCRWWNLLPLCQRCHLSTQARVLPERPWLFAHSPWFRPYVCGFYAHYYGRVDITAEQATADPDRYLRLGQPWLYVYGAEAHTTYIPTVCPGAA